MCARITEGKEIAITNEKEAWGEARLPDGRMVRFKTIILEARKLKNDLHFRTTTVFDVQKAKQKIKQSKGQKP